MIAVDTITGGREFEKRYGRDRCLSIVIISLWLDVKPPAAPPIALPIVLVTISTFPITPQYSIEPLPEGPKNPVACESSTITRESYFSANKHISINGATSPSIENTPSVAIILNLAVPVSFNFSSRSFISMCLNLNLLALQSLMPSIIEAWFNSSLRMASSSLNNVSKSPVFASKQEV